MFCKGRALGLLTSIQLKNQKIDTVCLNTYGPAHGPSHIYHNFSKEYFSKVNLLDKRQTLLNWGLECLIKRKYVLPNTLKTTLAQ